MGSVPDLSTKERKFVSEMFQGDIGEKSSLDKGLDREELSEKIEALRETENVHHLSDQDIDRIDKALEKKL